MKRKMWLASLAAAVLLAVAVAGGNSGKALAGEVEENPQAAVEINEKNFPDSGFRDLVSNYDTNPTDGVLSDAELASVTSISIDDQTIASLKGIEFFTSLKKLECVQIPITELDVSKNTALSNLNVTNCKLTSLDLSKNVDLAWLQCGDNEIAELDLSKNVQLNNLTCYSNKLTKLDLNKNMKLQWVDCGYNPITEIDLSDHKSLQTLDCNSSFYDDPGEMKAVNLSGCTALVKVNCSSNKIEKLDVSGCESLVEIDARKNCLKSLDLTGCSSIQNLLLFSNDLTALDVSMCPELNYLDCAWNPIVELDLSKNAKLGKLECYNTHNMEDHPGGELTKLDISGCRELSWIDVGMNKLTELDVSKLNLNYLDCCFNEISVLDLSKSKNLMNLFCNVNKLTELDVSMAENLENLYCNTNKISKLKINCPMLMTLHCEENQLTELDLSKCTGITTLYCNTNELTKLDLSKSHIYYLHTHYNKITTLDLSTFESAELLQKIGMDVAEDGNYLISNDKGVNERCFTMDWDTELTGIGKVAMPTKPATPTPKPGEPTPTTKPGEPTPTPAPVKDPSIADFVERLYTVALNRAAEPEGKAYWVKEIENGNRTGGDCAHFFLIEAEEFRNRGLNEEDFVETLYLTFFDRASEPNGKAFWVGQLKNGTMTRNQVIAGFIDSTEWCNVCANYGVKSGAPNAKAEIASKNAIKFATRLYTCCLGRSPEEAGLKYWSLALTNLEQTGCSAAKQFFKSDEFVNKKFRDEIYILKLYSTFMNREPESSEMTYWLESLQSGAQTRDSILAFFGQSEEFTNICKKYGIDRGTI
ncbi:MAG: DUF4214 domain-containing protein [Clostridiales bacterium]|nr:DUF4214 domain-containing protein [Clostridiales bacterium]